MNTHIKTVTTRSWSTGVMLLATVIAVTACSGGGGGGGDGISSLCDVPLEASLTSADRIGGATTSTVLFSQEVVAGEQVLEQEWTLYNVANELRARPVSAAAEDDFYHAIEVSGYIKDIAIVSNPTDGVRYALLAMGSEGIAVINLADPAAMKLVSSVAVNYYQDGITFTDGGGNIVPDNVIASNRAPISSLVIYDPPTPEAELQLLIGDAGYGVHKTLLSNLLGASGPVLEADGTLLIDADDNDPTTAPITPSEVYTLQFAGEVPWGGPESMTLYGTAPNQRLFVAMGFLGMGIFDPETLKQVGAYNLYTDASATEDWFIDMDVSLVVQSDNGDPFIDDFTGMMDYRQASFEITDVWHGDDPNDVCLNVKLDWCTPWAAFDRYGKYYYMARAVDVATFDVEGEPKTIAYIAYGLAGLVAVDVTGYHEATPPNDPSTGDWGNYLKAAYLGFAPAVPANGPDTPTGTDAKSLFPHFGSGMLKEAGAIDVKVKPDGGDGVATTGQVYYSDHFAGLVVMDHAEDPATNWKGPTCPCDNDDPSLGDGELGDHWPDFEFVTSYDMAGADEHETLPAWMADGSGPDLLATGEVSGHGNALALSSVMNTAALGEIDVVLTAGAGGMNFLDIEDLEPATPSEESFDLPVYLATTDEIGADADGLPNQPISIGHTEGVDAWHQYLFVADGPHGASVWEIANDLCQPTDDVHLVANTLQDEYEVTNTNNIVVTPTPHAYDVVLDLVRQKALVLSQSLGLRQFGITDVQDGLAVVGSPLLQQPIVNNMVTEDIFEHNVDSGNVVDYISRQDHAYDVVVRDTLAFVADGSNGLTVYDLTKVADYSVPTGDHVISNLGAEKSNPLLGRATALQLWTDPNTGTEYAFVAAGHAGIAVVDISEVENTLIAPDERMVLLKRFEPRKPKDEEEAEGYGKADGRSVDVQIVGDYAYFTYDSFGIVAYRIDDPDPLVHDLISPLPEGTDPTKIWKPGSGEGTYDYRPDFVARFKLQDETLGGWPELAGWGGGALGMTTLNVDGRQLFYVAYGDAGVIKLDWTDPALPVLEQHLNTVGEAADVTVLNGRAYVADNAGGIALIK